MDNLTINKIKEYCDKNEFKFRDFGHTVYISTLMDEWIIKTHKQRERGGNTESLFMVQHVNTCGNRSGKHHFHTQRYASDIDFIFNNIIVPHEKCDGAYNKAFKIASILKKINVG